MKLVLAYETHLIKIEIWFILVGKVEEEQFYQIPQFL